MRNEKKDRLAKEITQIARSATRVTQIPNEGLWWPKADGTALGLHEPEAQKFRSVASNLSKVKPFSDFYTESFLRKSLSLVVEAYVNGGEQQAKDLLDELINQLEAYNTERVIYIAVEGLEIDIDSLQVGNVTFVRFDDHLRKSTLERLAKISSAQVRDSNDLAIETEFEKRLDLHLTSHVCASYTVISDPERGWERAVEETRRAIEIIVFACVSLSRPDTPQADSYVGLSGETPRQGPWLLGLDDKSINVSHSVVPNSHPIRVDEESLIGMRRVGAMNLSEVLRRPNGRTSELEGALLRSVHWLYHAQSQSERENQVLSLTTALEVLFTQQSGGGITALLSESVALINGNSLEDRLEIKRFVSKMYSARSGVSHGGIKSVSNSEVHRFRKLVASTISRIISQSSTLQKKQDLLSMLERARLGGEVH